MYKFEEEIEEYAAACEQEKAEKEIMLQFIRRNRDNVLQRSNEIAHMTGSSMIFNEERTKVLMVYHNIYKSWSWTGGHADGEENLLALAIEEAKEETGITKLKVLSGKIAGLDILPVPAHIKKGVYVAPHLHLSLAYLFMASERQLLQIREEENSAVAWIPIEKLEEEVREEEMHPVYKKLVKKGLALPEKAFLW